MPVTSGFATLRDLAAFLAGLALLAWSIMLNEPPPDPLSVAVGAALVGLPAAGLVVTRREDPPDPGPREFCSTRRTSSP